MKTIILDMQSMLYAKALRRVLAQELEDCQVVLSEGPARTAEQCRLLQPEALLLEVTDHSPWSVEDRLALLCEARRSDPGCKSLLLVDEGAAGTVAQVKRAKQRGSVDGFLFTSASETYLAAVVDSL